MKNLILILFLLVTSSASAQQVIYTPNCSNVDDTAAFQVLITKIVATGSPGTITIPQRPSAKVCALGTIVFPSTVTIDNTNGSGIGVLDGATVTVSKVVNPDGKQLFFNVGSGHGKVQSGPGAAINHVTPQWFGFTGTSTTLDYNAIQSMSDFALGPALIIGTYATMAPSSTVTDIIDPSANFNSATLGQTLFLRYPNAFVASSTITEIVSPTHLRMDALPFDFHNGPGVCGFGQVFDCSAYAIGKGENAYVNKDRNIPMYFPAGTYSIGSHTWTIRNAVSVKISGAGRQATKIVSNQTVLAFDGLWYSQFEGLEFDTLTNAGAVGALEVDGNVPGHAYTTRGVQGNTFKDVYIDGGGSSYGLALCRQGTSGGQCSENAFLNLHLNNASFAPYFQTGSNALNNTFVGGNFQNYPKHGAYLNFGSAHFISVGFQSTYGYTQVLNGGWDISAAQGGAGEPITVTGCRTESLRFYNGAGAQPPILIGNKQTPVAQTWSATTAFSLNQAVIKTSVSAGTKLYVNTTAGTSGSSEPTWPNSGTVTDGSAVWTMTEFDVINTSGGITLIGNTLSAGNTKYVTLNSGPATSIITASKIISPNIDNGLLLIDRATNNADITITLPNFGPYFPNRVGTGKTFVVKALDTNAHTITIVDDSGGNPDGVATVIPGGSRGWVALQFINDGVSSPRYVVIDKSFGLDAATLNGATFASPGPIGGTTPSAASITDLTVSGKINGVKIYRALLTQTSTNAPVATVLENSLGGTVVWARTSQGVYTATLASPFTSGKTQIFFGGSGSDAASSNLQSLFSSVRTSTSVITVYTKELDTSGPQAPLTDAMLSATEIKITVDP